MSYTNDLNEAECRVLEVLHDIEKQLAMDATDYPDAGGRRLYKAAASAIGRVRRAYAAEEPTKSPTEAARPQGGGL